MNFAITPAETSVAGKHAFCVHGQKFVVSERYTPVETVGVGSYGIVVSAVDKYTGEKVAIKRIAGAFEDVVDGKRILREIRAMRLLSHANVRMRVGVVRRGVRGRVCASGWLMMMACDVCDGCGTCACVFVCVYVHGCRVWVTWSSYCRCGIWKILSRQTLTMCT